MIRGPLSTCNNHNRVPFYGAIGVNGVSAALIKAKICYVYANYYINSLDLVNIKRPKPAEEL